MTEHTDKEPKKSGKAASSKRPAQSRSPKGKQATAPGSRSTAAAAKKPAAKKSEQQPAEPAFQAPDPATIVFGSNRPIVAAPQKMPESSGLKFSGPSLGELKSSGPQTTSPKASGLTFSTGAGSKPAGSGQAAMKALPPKPQAQKPATPRPASAEAKPAEPRKPDAARAEAGKAPTKPAIAPQASGRRLEKERSSAGFIATFMALAVVVGGLAVWINQSNSPRPQTEQVAAAPAPREVAPVEAPAASEPVQAPAPAPAEPRVETRVEAPAAAQVATPVAAPVVLGPSPRAPMSPGPLADLPGTEAPAGGLSIAEISEIQQLLARLDLAPGNTDGVLTEETSAAIRSYQDMAGLPGDGEANPALLEELRAVVELYGS